MAGQVAIVILNWNGAEMLRRFLPSVIAHSGEAEIVVADNGSTDNSLQILAEEFPSVRRIVLEQNYGFAEGYNRALEALENAECGMQNAELHRNEISAQENNSASCIPHSASEYYLLLNSDVEVPEGWLDPLLSYMDAHPDVAACQPKLRCEWNRQLLEYAGACGGFLDRLGYPFCRGRVFDVVEEDHGQYDTVAPIFWATGAALMIRREAYWQVGGLDGRFFAHQEEIDLCWRLRSRGMGIVCVPQSVAYHVGGGTLPKENPRKTYLNFRNNQLLLYKNLPQRRLRRVLFLRFWLDALASLVFLLKGETASFRAVWRGRRDFRRMKSDFASDRQQNLAASVCDPLQDAPGSLLWQYYVRGRKKWSNLPHPCPSKISQ